MFYKEEVGSKKEVTNMQSVMITIAVILIVGFCALSYFIAACLRALERIRDNMDILRADAVRTLSAIRSRNRNGK